MSLEEDLGVGTEQVETEQVEETPAKEAKPPVETPAEKAPPEISTEISKDGGVVEATKKPAEKPAEETPAETTGEAEVDIEAELAKVEKTAPGGANAGVVRDLQAERQARREAEKRAEALEAELAAARTAGRGERLPETVSELIKAGELSPDDAVTAATYAKLEDNRAQNANRAKAQTEQEEQRKTATINEITTAQREQIAAILSPEKVGQQRSYYNVTAMFGHLLTPKDAAEINQIVLNGGNGAAEVYKRCITKGCQAFPSLKPVFTFKKTSAPGTKPKEKPKEEPGIDQQAILEQEDVQGFLARQLQD